jgi:pyruvate/2-oxoglutarate dehydrogenase complex dihydrolipoamide dehydrogenase (E3) component
MAELGRREEAPVRVDVAVVGMGPGGEVVATRLAGSGLRVAAVEARLVGGECPYYACVPTKIMIRAADALAEARRVGELAGAAEVRPDFSPVAARIRDEATDDWDDTVAVHRLTGAGVEFVRGRARITGRGVLDVDGTVIEADRIVLNPGTDPAVPPVDGLAGTPFWTNRDAVRATAAPAELVVVGGGPVGCEFAQVFARFGSRVTLVQSGGRLLPRDEPEAGELVAERFAAEGIDVRTGAKVERVAHDGDAFTVTVSVNGGDGEEIRAERLLIAAGRTTDLAALGVGAYGLDESARGIAVDARMRAADGLWAIGDVTGEGAFTHMSMYQADIAVADLLGEPVEADYRAVPRVTFTDPEVGAVGLTEEQARARGLSVRTGSTPIPSSTRGWIHKAGNEGFIKLVVDGDLLVGATSAGPAGGEVLGALAVAVHGRVPVSSLRRMIFAYPTFHRAISAALDDLD